jgi:hypothetical protein
MKWFFLTVILLFINFMIGYNAMAWIDKNIIGRNSVLSMEVDQDVATSEISPTPTVVVPTEQPTSTPTPLPTKVPTPTAIPQPKFSSEEIQGFIERFAAQYAVDANVLRHLAVCESGFNAEAVNGAYAGLFQFAQTSWRTNRAIMGEDPNPDLRFNAEEATQTAAYMVSQGRGAIWPNCYP